MKIDLKKYAPQGTKDCESNCMRRIVNDENNVYIVCDYCKRIVREIKK